MNLTRKLMVSFIFSIIISILTASTISDIMVNKKFDKFLTEEQNKRFNEIYQDINNVFLEKGENLKSQDLEEYAKRENLYLEVRDEYNTPVCHSGMNFTPMDRDHVGCRRIHGHHRMGHGNFKVGEGYMEKTFQLLDKNQDSIGTLIIGYVDGSYLTESGIIFKNTLSTSFFISGIIAVIFGSIISISLSKSLTDPIINITSTANEIRSGNLDSRSKVKSNVKEIAQLSNSINYLAKTLKEEESLRERYALDIAHELRTPLATLKAHLEAMVDGVWEASPRLLNILIDEIDSLAKLVEDLKSTFQDSETQLNINKSKINVSQELKNILSEFQPVFSEKGYLLESNIEKDIYMLMDRYGLKQIMHNLLSNAMKYLDNKGRVFVGLKKKDGNIEIIVEDNGAGIGKENLPFIFERFYRADISRNRDTGGTGLGLSITKTLVEAHNGQIYVESEENQGTKFIIIIPLS